MNILLKPFERAKTIERKTIVLVSIFAAALFALEIAHQQSWVTERLGAGLGFVSAFVLALFTWILLTGLRLLVLAPLKRARQHFERIGNGNYATPVLTRRTDELGDMLRALERMRINLAGATAARDTSERKHREILERSLRGFYQSTFEGRFLAANPMMAQILGYPSVEAMLTESAERLYVDARQRHEFVRLMETQGFVSGFECALRRRDGRVIWIAEVARKITEPDGRTYLEGFIDDITPRKEADQIKSDFVSFVTHQLRTPLAGIRWMLELAEQGTLDTETLVCVQDARLSAERLISLVNDLLDVTRLENERVATTAEPTALNDITQDVLTELAPLAVAKQQHVTVSTDDVPSVLVDPQLARRAVQNVLSNAIKFSPQGGFIEIRAVRDGEAVRWSVRDNGIGVPPAAQGHVFEKFFRADNAQVVDTEGTGLGLYLVRLIAVRAGGSVACESKVGEGSTFTLTLPVAETTEAVA